MPRLNDVTAGSGIPDAHLEVLGERLRMTRGRKLVVAGQRSRPGETGGTPAGGGSREEGDAPEDRPAAVGFIRLIREETPRGGRLVSYLVPEAGPAHDGRFDVVVLDSIVHVVPDADYLVAVVGQGLRRLRPGGCLAITDVRSLPLLEVSHTSAALAEAEPGTSAAQLADRIRRRVEAEDDLAVDPRIFDALRAHFPRIQEVRVTPRSGTDGEDVRFRYDVLLTAGCDGSEGTVSGTATALEGTAVAVPEAGAPAAAAGEAAGAAAGAMGAVTDWPDWDAAGFSRAELEAEFADREAEVIAVRDVPNARVERFAEALHRIVSEPDSTLAELRALVAAPDAREIDPQELCDLGRSHGYQVEIDFSRHEADGRFDLLAWRDDVPPPAVRRRPDDPADVVPGTAARCWNEFTNRRGQDDAGPA